MLPEESILVLDYFLYEDYTLLVYIIFRIANITKI